MLLITVSSALLWLVLLHTLREVVRLLMHLDDGVSVLRTHAYRLVELHEEHLRRLPPPKKKSDVAHLGNPSND